MQKLKFGKMTKFKKTQVVNYIKMKMLVIHSCPDLCNPMDCSPPGFSVNGILQAKYWSGLPFPSPGDLPHPGIKPGSPALQADSLPSEPPSEVAQAYPTLANPMDFSPPSSSIHGISQARILEWVAISFSRGSSRPRDRTWVSCIAVRLLTL